jgi:hypothetical protein
LVDLGYSDQTARYLSSIKLEMVSSNDTYYHYVQTTPSGIRSESILSLTPSEQFDTADAEKIVVAPGFEIFVKHSQVDKLDNGYHVDLAYFIPEETTPTDLKEYLGTIQQVRWEIPFGIKYAAAAGTMIFGTGVALESTVITPIETAGTVVSPPRITPAPVEDIGGILRRQQTADTAREVQQMIMDKERATAEAAEAAQRASQTADRQTNDAVNKAIRDQIRKEKLDLSRIADRAAREEAAQALSRISGRLITGLGTVWSLSNVYDDYRRGSDVLDAGRDCWKNPTNRLAQEAQRNDPFYERLGDQLDSAGEGLATTSAARVGVAGLDAAAGASTGFVGGLALGGVSQGFDAMLADGQFDEINDALRGITPCTPCPEEPESSPPPAPPGDHTPGPDEPGFYYTMGPRESYEPPERQVCRPPEPNQVTVMIDEFEDGSTGTPRAVAFNAIVNVTNLIPIPGAEDTYYQVYDHYEGNATGLFSDTIRYPDATIPEGECKVDIRGNATVTVKIQRHMSGAFDENGEYMLAEVNVTVEGDLPISQSPAGCYIHNGIAPSSTGQIGGALYGCSFFDVSEDGGHYQNGTGPQSLDRTNTFYDDCELTMGPIVPELMAPR